VRGKKGWPTSQDARRKRGGCPARGARKELPTVKKRLLAGEKKKASQAVGVSTDRQRKSLFGSHSSSCRLELRKDHSNVERRPLTFEKRGGRKRGDRSSEIRMGQSLCSEQEIEKKAFPGNLGEGGKHGIADSKEG